MKAVENAMKIFAALTQQEEPHKSPSSRRPVDTLCANRERQIEALDPKNQTKQAKMRQIATIILLLCLSSLVSKLNQTTYKMCE